MQTKLSLLGHRKPARIHWKADAPKTSHNLVLILIQRHNWAIFLRKWARRGRYSQWRSLSGHVERIFHKNWRGGYWQHLVSTAEATVLFCDVIFEYRIISRRVDAVWPPRSCDLTPLDYYLFGAVKDKCYTDKPETIDALKDNICEAIGEIQLHTIDNVLKNWTDRVGYCLLLPSQPFEWNYFPLITGRIVLPNKKEIWENIQKFFLKHFPKKKCIWRTQYFFFYIVVLMSDVRKYSVICFIAFSKRFYKCEAIRTLGSKVINSKTMYSCRRYLDAELENLPSEARPSNPPMNSRIWASLWGHANS